MHPGILPRPCIKCIIPERTLVDGLMAVPDEVRVDRLVREREEGAGRAALPFVLAVYFVRGPRTWRREAYLEPRNTPLLRWASKAQISRLA